MRFWRVLFLLSLILPAAAPRELIAQEPGKKYVIFHADDAGMSHSVNVATIEAMEKGLVKSASIMTPCPWFPEFAEYARKHPEMDWGIHLTLNSEFKGYRWGPVAPREQVKSLLDANGYLLDNDEQVGKYVKLQEVEIELRAQIEKARAAGIRISHIDTHMGALFSRPDLVELFANLGVEYRLPILMPKSKMSDVIEQMYPALQGTRKKAIAALERHHLPVLAMAHQFYQGGPDDKRRKIYLDALRHLPEGVTEIIVHCGIDNAELGAITGSSALRDSDRRLMQDPEIKAALETLGIINTSWTEFHAMAGKRQLIVHADDAGMSHSVNKATIEGLDKGIVTSCSIMVPCPQFEEFAEYARRNPQHDYGIHLTLNSEWKTHKWGPVAPREKVPSLLDKNGHLWPDLPEVAANVKASDVDIELRAQIDKAKKAGIRLTHLDTHMGAVMTRRDLIEVYVNLALEYDLPVLWVRRFAAEPQRQFPGLKGELASLTQALDRKGLPMLDALTTGVPRENFDGRRDDYLKIIRKLPPGVTQIIVHCGVADDELKAITGRAAIRDLDRRIFTDPAVIKEVKGLNVELVGWGKLRELANDVDRPAK